MATLTHRTAAAAVRVGRQAAIPREAERFDMPALARKMWPPMLLMGIMGVAAAMM